jgi:(p)ppGpp synthase/HD superfamily hydrolase
MADIYSAIQFMLSAHENQRRKIDGDVYAAHPIETAILLASFGCSEDVIVAGLLHDTLEDTATTYEEIMAQFGERVVALVQECTERDKMQEWHIRKKETLHFIRTSASYDAKTIILADKLSNIRSIQRGLRTIGDDIWLRFNAGYEDQKWYFNESLDALVELEDLEMYGELRSCISAVFTV